MRCYHTGEIPAIPGVQPIQVPDEIVELAQEIQAGINALNAQGHGDGEIKLTVTKGKIPFVDWTFRKFRMLKKK